LGCVRADARPLIEKGEHVREKTRGIGVIGWQGGEMPLDLGKVEDG